MNRTGRANFVKAGVVQAPKCDHCQTTLKPASATEWKCVNSECPNHDQPLNTGVYPVKELQG